MAQRGPHSRCDAMTEDKIPAPTSGYGKKLATMAGTYVLIDHSSLLPILLPSAPKQPLTTAGNH
jgi:hypothetical protein